MKKNWECVKMSYTNQRVQIWDYFSAPIALIWFLTIAWFFAILISQYHLVPLDQPVMQVNTL